MTHLRLTAPQLVGALALTLVGGTLATAQMGAYQPPAQTAPYAAQVAPYGTVPVYTPPTQQQTYRQAARPQMSPYTVAPQQQVQQQPRVQQQPLAQQQLSVQQQPSYRTAQYQLPNYQAPVPTARYAMTDDAQPEPEHVPVPEASEEPVAPVQQYSNGYQASDCNCNNGSPTAGNWAGYVQAPAAGCETGACDYTADCDYGTFGGGGRLLGGHLAGAGCGRQWFFGTYALFMTRDNPSYTKFAHLVDSPAAYPYYPSQSETILSTDHIEPDWQWGAEVRFGSTIGRPCGCNNGCGPVQRPYAWEVVYWGLDEDQQSAIVTDVWSDTDRIYGAVNYAGLQYDRDGAAGGTYADRPMNDYWDYDMPINDPAVDTNDVRILGLRARSNFSAQNLELNFIRFPVAGGGSCNPCCPPRFCINGVCGLRYMKFNDDLQYAAMFTTVDGGGNPNAGEPTAYTSFPTDDDNNIFHDVNVDNEMVGFQFGGNMNWLIGCKWSAFCDTQFGIYGNRISSYQRVYGGGAGEVTWVNSGNPVSVRSDKTDVSFLTELRAGMGYQVSCNCRLTTAYRVIAITGVALSGEQLSTNWADPAYVGIIDSNDSLVLHGLQMGVEWMY